MTDRAKGLAVALSDDIRVDDLERVMDAIRLFPGVASVAPVLATGEDYFVRERVREELRRKLFEVLD